MCIEKKLASNNCFSLAKYDDVKNLNEFRAKHFNKATDLDLYKELNCLLQKNGQKNLFWACISQTLFQCQLTGDPYTARFWPSQLEGKFPALSKQLRTLNCECKANDQDHTQKNKLLQQLQKLNTEEDITNWIKQTQSQPSEYWKCYIDSVNSQSCLEKAKGLFESNLCFYTNYCQSNCKNESLLDQIDLQLKNDNFQSDDKCVVASQQACKTPQLAHLNIPSFIKTKIESCAVLATVEDNQDLELIANFFKLPQNQLLGVNDFELYIDTTVFIKQSPFWQCVLKNLDDKGLNIFYGDKSDLLFDIYQKQKCGELQHDQEQLNTFRKQLLSSEEINIAGMRKQAEQFQQSKNSTKYWTCVIETLNRVKPPPIPNYGIPFQRLDYHYQIEKCYNAMQYEDWILDTSFRKELPSIKNYDQLIQKLQTLNSTSEYWQCVLKAAKNSNLMEPMPFYGELQNMEIYQCFQYLTKSDIDLDKKLRKNVPSTSSAQDLLDFIKKENYNTTYWNCIQQSITDFISQRAQEQLKDIKSKDKPLLDLSPFEQVNAKIQELDCMSKYRYDDEQYLTQLRNFVKLTADTSYDIQNYISVKGWNSSLFDCIQNAINKTLPQPILDQKYFSLFNDKYMQQECSKLMQEKDKQQLQQLQQQAKQAKTLEEIKNILNNLNLTSASKHWECFSGVIATIYGSKNSTDQKTILSKFNCPNILYQQLNCEELQQSGDKKQKSDFVEFLDKCTDCIKNQRLISSYIAKLSPTSQYWTCAKDAIDRCVPPRPLDLPTPLNKFNKPYEEQCLPLLTYAQSALETEFRKQAQTFKTFKEARDYLNKANYPLDQEYWQCVISVINHIDLPESPSYNNQLIQKLQTNECLQKRVYEDYQKQLELKQQEQSIKSYQQLRSYLYAHKLYSEYWQCLNQQGFLQQPGPLPYYFLCGNTLIEDACKPPKNDININSFKAQSVQAKSYQQLRNIIESIVGNQTTDYWECVIDKLNTCKPPRPPHSDSIFDQWYKALKCYKYLTYERWLEDSKMRSQIDLQDMNEVRGYIASNNLEKYHYWQCMQKAANHVQLPKLILYKQDIINDFLRLENCESKMQYADFIWDEQLRKFANSLKEQDSKSLITYIHNNPKINQTNQYWKCVLSTFELLRQAEVQPFPIFFGDLNNNIIKLKCFDLMKFIDYIELQEISKYVQQQQNMQLENIGQYIVEKGLNSSYWGCIQTAIQRVNFSDFYPTFDAIQEAYQKLKCADMLRFGEERNKVDDLKQFAQTIARNCYDFLLYFETANNQNQFWKCYKQAILQHCLDIPPLFKPQFQCLNALYQQLNCHGYLTQEEVQLDLSFREFSKTQEKVKQLEPYLSNKDHINGNDQYWSCYQKIIQNCQPIIPGPFKPSFQCLNDKITQLGCYYTMTTNDGAVDQKLRDETDRLKSIQDISDHMEQNYKQFTPFYWNCYENAFRECHACSSNPEKYKAIVFEDDCYRNTEESLICSYFIQKSDYQADCKFRMATNTHLLTPNEATRYLINNKLYISNTYWICIGNVIRVCKEKYD